MINLKVATKTGNYGKDWEAVTMNETSMYPIGPRMCVPSIGSDRFHVFVIKSYRVYPPRLADLFESFLHPSFSTNMH